MQVNIATSRAMSATQRQALEQTVLTLPDSEKLWLIDILLDQLQTIPDETHDRLEDLEDAGLYQAMQAVKHEIPLNRAAALAELDLP
jgi:RelB Antitoxin alpha helical domain